jgi:transcriptional regulator with XRE-family HTH domain
MTDISSRFGKKVKEVRLKKNLSQGDLAKILDVEPAYISSVERGVRNISIGGVEKIAKALAVPINKLLS